MSTYAQFKKEYGLSTRSICREILAAHRDSIKAKKEEVALKNLELILEATLRVSNRKGFQAMSMRDLSKASGISMGALYDYFSGKEELLEMVQTTGGKVIRHALQQGVEGVDEPEARLDAAIRTHLFVSEAMQPWFFFSYMETRHLSPARREKAKQSELFTEGIMTSILKDGRKSGAFGPVDPVLTASLIKALVQDWYLKRWKYTQRRIKVDKYADMVLAMVLAYCRDGLPSPARKGGAA